MKYTRLIVFALAGMLASGISVDAQVSVRRTAKTGSEQSRDAASKGRDAKMKDARDKAAERKAKEKEAASQVSGDAKPKPSAMKQGAAGGGPVMPAKKTTPTAAQRRQQPGQVAEGKTLRQQAFDEYQKDASSETPWQHVVYRELDLNKEANASLYFPVDPMDGMTNLFRVIIDAFAKGDLKAYEYLDGREVFSEKYEVKPKDIFDKFQIYYQTKPASQRGKPDVFEIDESDVPCSEVLSYYIKERWEFDQKHSKYQARIICICPVLHRAGDFGGDAVKYPMFWLNYEDLRPFLRDHLIVNQGMNTAARYTMEEFFNLGQYDGTIYKEQNLRGLSLMQQYPVPQQLEAEQKRLDEELRSFKDSIWVDDSKPESEPVAKKSKGKAKESAAENNTAGEEKAHSDVTQKKNRRTKDDVDVETAAEEKEERATSKKSVRRNR